MNIQSALNYGVEGFQRAQQQVTQSAANIARQAVESSSAVGTNATNPPEIVKNAQANTALLPADRTPQSVVTELVNMQAAEHQAKASAKVITAADEMIGSIIDIKV